MAAPLFPITELQIKEEVLRKGIHLNNKYSKGSINTLTGNNYFTQHLVAETKFIAFYNIEDKITPS